jgi:hypothetical protein
MNILVKESLVKKGNSGRRNRRTFTIQEKINIVEKVLAGKMNIHKVTDDDGELIHYGSIESWTNAYLAGKFGKARDKGSAYVKMDDSPAIIKMERASRSANQQQKTTASKLDSLPKSAKEKLGELLLSLLEEDEAPAKKKGSKVSMIDRIQRKVLEKP